MFAVANKQQFKIKMYKQQIEKEQDNKEGHEKEQGNFCLKHSLKREGRECERGRDPSLPLLGGIGL